MDLLKALQWRYAVKKFDPSKEVDQQLVDKIIEAAWLAPTSSGLQPFQIIDITNHDLKNKIVPIAFDQLQVAECSHLLVFAAWDNYTAKRIDHIYHYISSERGQKPDRYKPYTEPAERCLPEPSGRRKFRTRGTAVLHRLFFRG